MGPAPFFVGKDARDLEPLLWDLYRRGSNYKLQGLAFWICVAAAEMALAGDLGLQLDLSVVDHEDFPAGHDEDTTLLFSESCTRFLIEVEPGKKFQVQTALMGHACIPIGRVMGDRLEIKGTSGKAVVDVSVDDLRAAFTGGFQG